MLNVQKGTIDRFLSAHEVHDNFLDGESDLCAQYDVYAHSEGCAQLSGVVIARMWRGCSVSSSAAATLTDCTVSDTDRCCVIVRGGVTAQLDESKFASARGCDSGVVWHAGSHVTATACHSQQQKWRYCTKVVS